MGLLDSLLEVPEHLRVWQMAGVRHFYIDPLLDRADASAGLTPAVLDMSPQTQASATPLGQASPGPAASPHTPAGAALSNAAAPAPAWPSQTAQAQPASPGPARLPDDPPGAGLPDDPDRWPLPWPSFFAKTPATPRLVITYRELGLDLTGQSDPRRRDLWRRLIGQSGLSGQGLVAFWPMAIPLAGALTDCPVPFACGVARLRPKLVAVFGEFPEAVRAELARHATLPVVVLPHPGTLLQNDPEALEHVVSTLRGV